MKALLQFENYQARELDGVVDWNNEDSTFIVFWCDDLTVVLVRKDLILSVDSVNT